MKKLYFLLLIYAISILNAGACSIGTQPSTASETRCSGTSAFTTLSITVTGSGTATYQWYSNTTNSNTGGTAILGATSISYTPSNTFAGTHYYYVVVSGCASSTSNVSGAITVNTDPNITTQPSSSGQTLCYNNTAASPLSVTATGYNLSYQWYSNTTNSNTGGTAIGGATSNSYTPLNTFSGTHYYYVIVSGGCGSPVASNVSGAITVNTDPNITAQPSNSTQTLCYNNTAASPLSVTATGYNLSYQWYSNTTNSNTGGTAIGGATSNSYTPLNTFSGTHYYYVIVSGGCGSPVASSVSGAVVVNLSPTAAAGSTTSATVCATPNSYTVPSYTANNGTISWTASSSSGSNGTFSGSSGSTVSPTYNFSPADISNGATVTLTMHVSNSPCTDATASFSLRIKPLPTATAGSTIRDSACASLRSFTLPSGYSSSNGTILWTTNGTGTLSHTTSTTPIYSFSSAEINTTVRINVTLTMTVSDSGTCTAATTTFNLIIKPSPAIHFTYVDSSRNCLTGNLFTFATDNPGNVYTSYQWNFAPSLGHSSITSAIDTIKNIHFGGSGTNQIVAVKANSATCYAVDTFKINVYPMPDSTFTLNNSTGIVRLCQDSAVNFVQPDSLNTSTSTLIWGDLSPNTTGSTASHNYPATQSAVTSYTVTYIPVSIHHCSVTNTAFVSIYPMPNASFVIDSSHHCRRTNSYQFTDASSAAYYTLNSWYYDFGDASSTNSANASHSYNHSNTTDPYTVREIVKTEHGCADTAVGSLVVYRNPTEAIQDTSGTANGRADTVCGSTSFVLIDQVTEGTSPFVSYLWYDQHSNALSTTSNLYRAAMNADSSMLYTVVVTDSKGCTDTISRRIQYFPDPRHSVIRGLDTVCSGAQNLPYHVQSPENSVHYAWDAWDMPRSVIGRDTAAEVSFPSSGYSSGLVVVYATNSPYKCTVTDTKRVVITSDVVPTASVLLNASSSNTNGVLICTNNSAGNYQWGYDNLHTLQSTSISGETQQALILGGSLPSTTDVYYWVEIGSGSCVSKVYLYGNSPTSVVNTSADQLHISAYPNPFSEGFYISVSGVIFGEWSIDVYDMTGRKVHTQKAVLDMGTPLYMSSDKWPAGIYSVSLYSADGQSAVMKLTKD